MSEHLRLGEIACSSNVFMKFFQKVLMELLQEFGLSKAESDVLMFLANHPEIDTSKEIADMLGISKAYVSKAIEQLSAKNYIEITIGKEDRRFQHIKITEHTNEIVKALKEKQEKCFEIICDGVTKKEMDVFLRVHTHFVENLKKQL